MTIIDKSDATGSLGEYASNIAAGAVIVTSDGHPVAALVPIENTDLETVALCTNHEFLSLIERSRARVRTEGGISSEEMRRRFD
jgi:antitoxin (DNA-binding transcriptional repressor) of toxin-antitoxin stability system